MQQSAHIHNKQKFSALVTLSIGYLLAWVAYSQWASTFSAHSQKVGVTLNEYSLLWTVNGALIVLVQPFLSSFVKRFAKTLKVQMVIGFIIFILTFLVIANAEAFTGFMLAMIILTIGEMFVWPAVPTIANKLAPKGREGFYQGFVNSTATGGRMLGPLLGGIVVDLYGIHLLFTILIALLCIGMVTTILFDRKLNTYKDQRVTYQS